MVTWPSVLMRQSCSAVMTMSIGRLFVLTNINHNNFQIKSQTCDLRQTPPKAAVRTAIISAPFKPPCLSFSYLEHQVFFSKPISGTGCMHHYFSCRLVPEIRADGSLEASGALAQDIGQVLEIVAGGDAELADEVLGS